MTDFYEKAAEGDDSLLRVYMNECGISIDTPNGFGQTALMGAAEAQDLELIESLIQRGANVDKEDFSKRTPLFYACIKHNIYIPLSEAEKDRQLRVVQCLCDRGSDLHHLDCFGHSAFSLALSSGNLSLMKYLAKQGVPVNDTYDDSGIGLLTAVKERDLYLLQYLLAAGVSPDAISLTDRETALLRAVLNNDLEMAALLLKYGANIEKAAETVDDFVTPLMQACSQSSLEMVQFLVENKADINNCIKKGGIPPIAYVPKSPNAAKIVDYLLQNGAKTDLIMDGNYTVLMCVIQTGSEEAVKMILERPHEINLINCEGNNALMYAIEMQNMEIVRMILEKGGCVDITNDEGETPLSLALEKGNQFIVDMIRRAKSAACKEC